MNDCEEKMYFVYFYEGICRRDTMGGTEMHGEVL